MNTGVRFLVATIFFVVFVTVATTKDFEKQPITWVGEGFVSPVSVIVGDTAYLNLGNQGASSVDFRTGETKLVQELISVEGAIGGKLVGGSRRHREWPYFFYVREPDGTLSEFQFLKPNASQALADYQNGQFFGAEPLLNKEAFAPYRYDIREGRLERIPLDADVREISPDRTVLLLVERLSRSIYLWNIQERRLVTTLEAEAPGEGYARFLTSQVLLVAPTSGAIHFWRLYTIEGQFLGSFRFVVKDYFMKDLIFSRDLQSALVSLHPLKGGGSSKTGLFDTTDFRDWVKSLGVWFDPTTGTCIDTEVRLRQSPNLEAKTLGYLDKGEALEVLDRSGIKQTISPYGEHWWYQVKRKDGTVGWSYGVFLDVEGEKKD